MRLSLVGCGYVGQAIAQQLQGRADLELTVTTTSEERRDELSAIADQVLVISADDPDGLLAALDGRDAAIFCLGPKGNRQVDAAGYRRTFNASFRCLEQLLPQLPVLQQIIYTGSCSIYGDANGGWIDESTAAQPRDEHGAVLLEAERQLLAMASQHGGCASCALGRSMARNGSSSSALPAWPAAHNQAEASASPIGSTATMPLLQPSRHSMASGREW